MFGKIITPAINTQRKKVKPLTTEVKNEQRTVEFQPITERPNKSKRKRHSGYKEEKNTTDI